ncbi:MAG: hypothetical protein ABR569_06635 [Gaiellaceae bacterium]
MRRLVVIFASLMLLAPVSALALPGSAGDGTLAVRHASGDSGQVVVQLNLTGSVVGQLDAGRIRITDADLTDGAAVDVAGAERTVAVGNATVYSGTNIRFRAIGGLFRIAIIGRGIDVNAVGQGSVYLAGSALFPANDGKYSLNGGDWKSLPDTGVRFPFSAGT